MLPAADILSSKQARERAISNHQRVDLEKFTGFLKKYYPSNSSTQKCAKSIAHWLESLRVHASESHPVAAADWGNTGNQHLVIVKLIYLLMQPKKGDIYIIDRTVSQKTVMDILPLIQAMAGFLILNKVVMRFTVTKM